MSTWTRIVLTGLMVFAAGSAGSGGWSRLECQCGAVIGPTRPPCSGLEPGYRYPQAGWIVLHIEGEPYERGYQHGRLMAPEIARFVGEIARYRSSKAPADAWQDLRLLADALFLRRFDSEYLEEMKGIADGAAAAGAKWDGRPLDLLDLVTINADVETNFLENALEATATGLEGRRFREPAQQGPVRPQESHCSAFAATGPATADGQVVFGHITMWNLFHAYHYNVWLDVKPARGHRVLDANLPRRHHERPGLLHERSRHRRLRDDDRPDQVRRDRHPAGRPHPPRPSVWRFDRHGRRHLATGQQRPVHQRVAAGRHQDQRDRDVRAGHAQEPPVEEQQERVVRRDDRVLLGLQQRQGPAGAARDRAGPRRPAGQRRLPSVRSRPDLARAVRPQEQDDRRRFRVPGLHDPAPVGRALARRQVHHHGDGPRAQDLGEIRPAAGAHLGTDRRRARAVPRDSSPGRQRLDDAPRRPAGQPMPPTRVKPVDLARINVPSDHEPERINPPAWHGTILPESDADIWLAAAFADYERIVAREKAIRAHAAGGKLGIRDRERLALALFAPTSRYLTAVARRGGHDLALSEIHADLRSDDWYDIASGKGVLVLAELRAIMGDKPFDKFMDEFGRAHAGRRRLVRPLFSRRPRRPTANRSAISRPPG